MTERIPDEGRCEVCDCALRVGEDRVCRDCEDAG
jgi:hypothetical protein